MTQVFKVSTPKEVATPGEEEVRLGKAKISLRQENGIVLTKEYGFTVQEENGNVLSFDFVEHPEMGTMLLFGNQVFALKFWKDEDLEKGIRVIDCAVMAEQIRRKSV